MKQAPKITHVSPEWESRRIKIQQLLNSSKRRNYLANIQNNIFEAEVFEPR
jgi:hypothetical protein